MVPYEARGQRKDYACATTLPFHSHEEGMADVFYATHKATGTPVVLKQLHGKYPPERKTARMAREIMVGRFLSGHPNSMPVWDAGADNRWFVMPVAQAIATECPDELKDPATLRDLVESLCSVLSAAHDAHKENAAHGWVHRDVKPSNVLRLDGRWVLADWGIARRPAGQTTSSRTRVGASMGSEGFAAPELSSDAHSAGPSADIYSLGQLIGWAVTGRTPQQNIPLIPDSGPWRAVVRAATLADTGRRLATVRGFLELVAREIDPPSVPPVVQGETLRDSLDAGAPNAPEELVALAAAHLDDVALYCDVLLKIDPELLVRGLMADPPRALEIVRAMPDLLGAHRPTERGEVDAVILWLFTIARHAADAGQLHLLEESCNGAFAWDALWDQWAPQDKIRPWLRTLTGDAAGSVAGALRDHPDCALHFSSLAKEPRVDHRIRLAVSATADQMERGIAATTTPSSREAEDSQPPEGRTSAPDGADAGTAGVLLKLLPPGGDWYKVLRKAETMFRVPLSVSHPVCDALEALEDDPVGYADPALQSAYDELLGGLQTLCWELNGMTDISDGGPQALEISHPGTEDERNELNRRACAARDQFLPAYKTMVNLLNARGLVARTGMIVPVEVTPTVRFVRAVEN
ncbi:hypothetical protein ABT143_04510 [Streptomyces sp. NPDC002033]|uniref:serine/threonine protein kinase n=1 Tax=unclassified Streptomyces TaxID=2593676 RepID=UPI003326828E